MAVLDRLRVHIKVYRALLYWQHWELEAGTIRRPLCSVPGASILSIREAIIVTLFFETRVIIARLSNV